jgi:hypothetical protein
MRDHEDAIRERAYLIWQREGQPDGRAQAHWERAITETLDAEHGSDSQHLEDEEKVLEGRLDANMPALLTKDVRGG